MKNNELARQLKDAGSLEEVKEIVADYPDIDANKVWKEIQGHKSDKNEKLDLDELDSVSGGADRDWQKKDARPRANGIAGAVPTTTAWSGR